MISAPDREIVVLEGGHDLATLAEIVSALDSAVAEDRETWVDLRPCTSVDTRVLSAIVDARRRLANHGHELRFVLGDEAAPGVRKTLAATGLDRIVPLADA